MKQKKIFALLFFLLLLVTSYSMAQTTLYISGGNNLFISAGTSFSTDSLVLLPSVNFNLTGENARIKNIVSNSNSAEDLKTINALQITNYTLRDRVEYGNKMYKKVIAQEVEKVYPQLVSKHTDFIPNVYQITTRVTRMKDGYRLQFAAAHHLSDSAKKLRVLFNENEGMQQVVIVSIPTKNEVVIRTAALKTDKVFVYGEEVADFRTVDYEGLTTLNISATQELSKLLAKQQSRIDEQDKKISRLSEALKASLDTRIVNTKTKE